MKIITLHQPWASLVALGLKRYETRHWSTSYRGPLLIHAAKRTMAVDEHNLLDRLKALRAIDFKTDKDGCDIEDRRAKFPLGCIVAIADLSACLEMRGDISRPPSEIICIPLESDLERAVGNWQSGRFALRLDNVQPLPSPIPFKSRQGKLLDAPPALRLMVQQQLGRTA